MRARAKVKRPHLRSAAADQLLLFKPRGGKRRGAGRPPKAARAGSPHKTRPAFPARHPIHVVLRTVAAVGNLRRGHAYRAIRRATLACATRGTIRIIHASIQRSHLHLLVEAPDKAALACGMQGFQVSAARHLNTEIGKEHRGPRRTGTVFPDRYHAEIITSPTQARHSLSYVLCNWRKHGEAPAVGASGSNIDPYSTGMLFDGWAEHPGAPVPWRWSPGDGPLVTSPPRTWMLREGWRKAGPISCHDVPSAKR